MENSLQSFRNGTPRRFKIFIAAISWTLVAIVLFYRSCTLLMNYREHVWLKVCCSVIFGILFYLLLFFKISFSHTRLTVSLRNDDSCSIPLFDIKRDILITIIAISGFLLRISGIVALKDVSILYISTGIPLLLSTLRYYYFGTYYKKG